MIIVSEKVRPNYPSKKYLFLNEVFTCIVHQRNAELCPKTDDNDKQLLLLCPKISLSKHRFNGQAAKTTPLNTNIDGTRICHKKFHMIFRLQCGLKF